MKCIFLRIAFILLAAWLGLAILAWLFYPRLLYHPERNLTGQTPQDYGMADFKDLTLVAADGVRLHAWHIAPDPEFENGERIFAAYRGWKEFFVIGDDHNVGFLLSGEKYAETIARFAESVAKRAE